MRICVYWCAPSNQHICNSHICCGHERGTHRTLTHTPQYIHCTTHRLNRIYSIRKYLHAACRNARVNEKESGVSLGNAVHGFYVYTTARCVDCLHVCISIAVNVTCTKANSIQCVDFMFQVRFERTKNRIHSSTTVHITVYKMLIYENLVYAVCKASKLCDSKDEMAQC